ncbi:MAG: galactokinase [Candidatus Eremiobacteraeota bacterium]|nr:galactokinase [Candidatus Eremiobacteraeota bacterium]
MQQIYGQLQENFKKIFGAHDHPRYFFAPGRVNLIGEHTDYNGGNVFPCALDIGTYALALPRKDEVIRCYSENFPATGIIDFTLDSLIKEDRHDWANYPKGVLRVMADKGHRLSNGLDILFYGTIPNGAGLSSSASIEVLMATVVRHYGNFADLPGEELALLCQKAENQFIGVKCGIMDQFVIAMGKTDHAILLDCNTLSYQYAPLKLGEHLIVIANTNKKRGLAESRYNERRAECDHALSQLQTRVPVKSLCELDVAQLEKVRDVVTSPVEYKRVFHAVSENQRTLAAFKALQINDLTTFGELMNQSHISLRDYYEVTGKELDSLAAAAWNHTGCTGSRMTGAGFGGCTVSLVNKNQVDDFIRCVGADYRHSTGLEADFYVVKAGNGAGEINQELSHETPGISSKSL